MENSKTKFRSDHWLDAVIDLEHQTNDDGLEQREEQAFPGDTCERHTVDFGPMDVPARRS
jgi:hypothetical protein